MAVIVGASATPQAPRHRARPATRARRVPNVPRYTMLEAFRLHFSLARQLAAQRRAQHLTQKQLADRSGIDQAEISRIERAQANPTTATLAALTGALGLDVQLVPSNAP